jgi:hypothetical protein
MKVCSLTKGTAAGGATPKLSLMVRRPEQQGNTLILTLVMCLTIGTVLASYLGVLGSRYKVTMRSQCWNQAVPVLEAGLEEALTHMQDDVNNPAANGWTLGSIGGQAVYSKRRSLADGSYFLVNIYNAASAASNTPFIYSTGFVPSPLSSSAYISRTAKIAGTNQPLINQAFGAVAAIQMNGSGLASDSFDSSDPALSTNGQYDPNKTASHGNVASVYGPVNLGNHNIAGSLYLGPTASSSVGSGQVSGQIYSDFNISFPDVALPTTSWLPAPTSIFGGVNSLVGGILTILGGTTVYDFTSTGDYYLSGGYDLHVEPGVTARVRIDSTTFNPGTIHIHSTNGVSGTLIIYQVSGSGSMNGNVTVDSGRARNFWYYGLPGVTSLTYGGNSSFVGVVYAPEADLTLNGGGNNNGFIGASITKSITMNGHYNFHFDQDLLSAGPSRAFVVTSWKEL